jgi:hypothetical protein
MREKLAYATAYFLSEGLSHGRCFQSLYKDHVVKDGEFSCLFLSCLASECRAAERVSVMVATLQTSLSTL